MIEEQTIWGYGVKRHFHNISVISWRSVLLMAETGVHGKPWICRHWQTSLHSVVSSTPHHDQDLNSPR